MSGVPKWLEDFEKYRVVDDDGNTRADLDEYDRPAEPALPPPATPDPAPARPTYSDGVLAMQRSNSAPSVPAEDEAPGFAERIGAWLRGDGATGPSSDPLARADLSGVTGAWDAVAGGLQRADTAIAEALGPAVMGGVRGLNAVAAGALDAGTFGGARAVPALADDFERARSESPWLYGTGEGAVNAAMALPTGGAAGVVGMAAPSRGAAKSAAGRVGAYAKDVLGDMALSAAENFNRSNDDSLSGRLADAMAGAKGTALVSGPLRAVPEIGRAIAAAPRTAARTARAAVEGAADIAQMGPRELGERLGGAVDSPYFDVEALTHSTRRGAAARQRFSEALAPASDDLLDRVERRLTDLERSADVFDESTGVQMKRGPIARFVQQDNIHPSRVLDKAHDLVLNVDKFLGEIKADAYDEAKGLINRIVGKESATGRSPMERTIELLMPDDGQVSRASPADIYVQLDELKRRIGGAAKGAEARAGTMHTSKQLKSLYSDIQAFLEDDSVWGPRTAQMQRDLNSLWVPYLDSRNAWKSLVLGDFGDQRAAGWNASKSADWNKLGRLLDAKTRGGQDDRAFVTALKSKAELFRELARYYEVPPALAKRIGDGISGAEEALDLYLTRRGERVDAARIEELAKNVTPEIAQFVPRMFAPGSAAERINSLTGDDARVFSNIVRDARRSKRTPATRVAARGRALSARYDDDDDDGRPPGFYTRRLGTAVQSDPTVRIRLMGGR